MHKRVLVIAVVALVIAGGALYALRPERGVPDDAPTEDEMARSIGTPVMEHLYQGHVAERSGEIMLVPKPNNFLIGEWDLRTLGSANPTLSTSHPNPWNYLTRVPIVLYGPGYVEPDRVVYDQTDIAALAPTYARLLGMDDFEGDEEPLDVSVGKQPKVIFTVVIDGGGWNTLQWHADSWPNIHRVMQRGTTYANATIGSAPSITGALHATFGTGVYPRTHGIPGNQMRGPDGTNVDTWQHNADPTFLEVPTVSELWDEQTDNRAIVGTVSYEGWHLGMIGHGAQRTGGDKDIAVLWQAETEEGEPVNSWWVNEDYYELPDYLLPTDLDTLESYEEAMDDRDGLGDGAWFGHKLEQLQEPLARPGSPAFVRFTGDAVEEVMRNEGIGRDDVTDMFWVEMKMPDYAGHAWNVSRPEQGDVLLETDRQIGRFLRTLDRTVGRGNYLFALSADHGQQPLPDTAGGWRINSKELQRDIDERFGKVVEKVTPVDIYIDHDALADTDYSIEDIARYIGTYTLGDNVPEGIPGEDLVPEGRKGDLLFAGAFSTEWIEGMTAEKIEGFGEGDYPEGDFTVDPSTFTALSDEG